MLKYKLLYLALTVVSAAFFLFYRGALSFILLLVLLAMPVLLLLLTVVLRLSLRISCSCDQVAVYPGQKAHITLTVTNRFLLPITQITAYIRCQNAFFEKPDKLELNLFAAPFSKSAHDVEIGSEHTGNVEIAIPKIRVFDYFGVFSLPMGVKEKYTITFLPKSVGLDVGVTQNIHSLSETNVYSKHKPGDDPSEVFAIRDYVPGDKPNHIHWKLSTKQDSLIVKDYSLPISKSVMLLPELCIHSVEDAYLADTVFEIVTSLSHCLIENEIQHSLGWYNPENNAYCTQEIHGYDGLYAALRLLFESAKYYRGPQLASMPAEHQAGISNLVYIAPGITSDHLDRLSFSKHPTALCTALNVVNRDSDQQPPANEDMQILTVKEGLVFECLNETFM